MGEVAECQPEPDGFDANRLLKALDWDGQVGWVTREDVEQLRRLVEAERLRRRARLEAYSNASPEGRSGWLL